MSRFKEFAKYTYSLNDVLQDSKIIKYQSVDKYEIYYAYVGRKDEPNVYDKRQCLILKDMGDEVVVLKITDELKNNKYRSLILNIDDA